MIVDLWSGNTRLAQTSFGEIRRKQRSVTTHFLEEDFWTIFGEADSPIGCG
jgi:hypothetical protein